jgi:predicted metalloendopeptidase
MALRLSAPARALALSLSAACTLLTVPAQASVDLSGRDLTVAACTDFYSHANGGWMARTVLPPDRARIGSFDELRMRNDRLLRQAMGRLVAEPARQDTPGLRLLATWWTGALDPAVAERAGLKPLAPLLAGIDALAPTAQDATRPAAPKALAALLGELTRHRLAAPLPINVGPDVMDVRRHVLYVGQGGLGLPDRDDYLKDDATSQRLRAAYRDHARRLLTLAGRPADDATLDALLAFETTLARAAMTAVQRRDPRATHNRRTLAALQQETPDVDWSAWLQAVGVKPDTPGLPKELVVSQPAFLQAVGQAVRTAPVATWQAYLAVRLLDAQAQWLAAPFQQAHFDFHERAVRGLQQRPPREEELLLLIGGRTGGEPLGQTLGELFVREAFSERGQQRALQLIEDVRAAMRTRIEGLDWMSAPTKQRALAKLQAMAPQVGRPDRWPDYGGLKLERDDPAGNALRVNAWGHAQRLAALTRPVDRSEWQTSPHIVNAFAGGLNRIIFPAGILQPPFFDAEGDDALNYGAIGMVIGHEITHHFDDRGRQYDEVGNLRDWWAPEDAAAYRERADRVVALYGAYEPLPGLRINGRQMLGENISDLGGLQIAFDAYRLALQRQARAGQPAAARDGLTPEQRFFVANAVIWRTQQRAQALEQQIRTGQHSSGPFRVKGPMSQMPAFAEAFQCKPGDPMVAATPVAVW